MQTVRQDVLRAAQDLRAETERSLTEKAMKSLRDYRRVRMAQRRLVAQRDAA